MSSPEETDAVYVDEKVVEYLDTILAATLTPEKFGLGRLAGILAVGALADDRERALRSAKERALHAERKYVVPRDIQGAAMDVLSLTLELKDSAEARELGVEGVIQAILDWIEIP